MLRVLRGYASPGELLDRQPRLDHFVFKELFLSFSPGLALRPFPASGVIHITRDGRDVADSLARSYDGYSQAFMERLQSDNPGALRRSAGKDFVPWWVDDRLADDFLKGSPYVRGCLFSKSPPPRG